MIGRCPLPCRIQWSQLAAVDAWERGCGNPLRHFAALVGYCDVAATGEPLAMHIALALTRRAVILFGPTNAPVNETYGLDEKLLPDMTGLRRYKTSCDFVPHCMDLLSVEMLQRAFERQLVIARRYGPQDGTSD